MWFFLLRFLWSMCFTKRIKVVSWAKPCKHQGCNFLEIPCKTAGHAALPIQRHGRKKGFCRHSKPGCVEELRWACGSAVTHQEVTQIPFMLQFPHLGSNYCVKDQGSANEEYNTRSVCGWVGPYLFQPCPLLWCTILVHVPGKEHPAAL